MHLIDRETSATHSVFATELRFTDAYRRHERDNVAIREAMCLRAQYPDWFQGIQEADQFAGRIRHARVGFSPDEWGLTTFGYFCQLTEEEIARADLGESDERAASEIVDYWRERNTSARVRAAYSPEMARYLPSDNWMGEPGIAFPLYRLTGGNADFGKLLALGLPGLTEEIERHVMRAAATCGDVALYEAMDIAVDVLADVCRFYAQQAREKANACQPSRRPELLQMAEVLDGLTVSAPRHFRDAIQLVWLYALAGDIRNLGRMDVYLGDFLARDLDSGVLDEREALRLLQSLWKLIADRNTRVHGRVIIGGVGRPNEASADQFALLAMEATRTVLEVEPQLSLRFYDGMNPALMQKALDVIGEGRTFPILYNDGVNVPAVERAFGVGREEAEQYVPFGCGEYILDHRSFGTPSGVINLLKALEVTLHNGRDPLTGKLIGLPLGGLADFHAFEDLWSAYRRQVEHFVRLMAEQEAIEYRVAGESAAFLYLSILYDDCMERGKGVFSGGIRYLGGTLETYGNTNAADSLTAIKQLVYEKRIVTREELLAALDANFEGHERVRNLLQRAPKYGNDDETADSMLVRVHEHVCGAVREQAARVGLHSYQVVIINNSANTLMGRWTVASADGRKAGEPMNNGNSPSSGMDRAGATALLNSLVKPSSSIHAGAVQNLKFSRELMTSHRRQIEALLETYWAKGGAQAMITVVSRGDLEAAMAEPEKYGHLFVRVGGFSARFVDLPRDVQLEILNRTLY